jgi:hypothetical protein
MLPDSFAPWPGIQMDLFDPAMSTSAPSAKSRRKTSATVRKSTSLPASGSGRSRSKPLDGHQIWLPGLDPAPANPSARQVPEAASMTSDISGPSSSGSLTSAGLTSFLASKFRQRTASLGSTLYELTWKERDTPLGFSIPAQRGWARRTSGNASTGSRCGWATPRVSSKNCSPADFGRRFSRQSRLEEEVHLIVSLDPSMDFGQMPSGSIVPTGYSARLNPGHARWLMGLPPTLGYFALSAMVSTLKSPSNLQLRRETRLRSWISRAIDERRSREAHGDFSGPF